MGRSILSICTSLDEPMVEALTRRLQREAGLAVWLAPWDLRPGEPLQEQLEHALAAAAACLVYIRSGGIDGWFNEQLRMAIARRVTQDRGFRVVPVILPGASGAMLDALPALLRRYVPVTFAGLDDQAAFRSLVAGALGLRPVDVESHLSQAGGEAPSEAAEPLAGLAMAPAPAAPPERTAEIGLHFVTRPEGVVVIWESDLLGRLVSPFSMPFANVGLPAVILALESVQNPAAAAGLSLEERGLLQGLGLYEGEWPADDLHRRVGQALYSSLTADPATDMALRRARAEAARRGLTTVLRLRLDSAQLAALPWELLWDIDGPLLLSPNNMASCVRQIELGRPVMPPPALHRPLRILALAPHTGIARPVLDLGRQALDTAWSAHKASGAVSIEWLSPVTPADLINRLHGGPPIDLLHFVGHGSYVEGQGRLLLDGPAGDTRRIGADQLAALLGGTPVVVLQACRSAMAEAGLLTGIAPALSAAGVPAIVAMQLSVSADAAARFATVFYRGLARGASLQGALMLARQALYVEEPDQRSWYVPTLTVGAGATGSTAVLWLDSLVDTKQ